MKLNKLFTILSLTAVAGGALTFGLSSNNNVKEADAISTGDTVYVRINSDWYSQRSAGDYFIHYWGYADDYTKLTQVDGQLYSATLPSCTGFQLVRAKSDLSVKWDYSQNCDYTTLTNDEALNNYVKMDDGWNNVSTSIHEYQPSKTPGTAYLRGTWTNGWKDFTKVMTVESDTVTTISGVSLSDGQKIKMMKIDNNYLVDYYGATTVNGTGGAKYDGQDVVIHGTALYNITVTTGNNSCTYTVDSYVDTDFNDAVDFAEDFKDDIYANCPYNYDTKGYNEGKSSTTLAATWKSYSQRFAGLTEKAQKYLAKGDESTDSDLNLFATIYDYVYGNYADVRLNANGGDFAGRTPEIVRNLAFGQTIVSNDSTMIIVLVSTVSLVAIGGFFFYKRKRV